MCVCVCGVCMYVSVICQQSECFGDQYTKAKSMTAMILASPRCDVACQPTPNHFAQRKKKSWHLL